MCKGNRLAVLVSLLFLLLTAVGCNKQEQQQEQPGVVRAGPGPAVLLAVLNCPDTVRWTMSGVCGSSAGDAQTKAANVARPNYSCQAGCPLYNVVGNAGPAGAQCVLQLNPPTYGSTYDVDLVITCR